MLTATAYRSAVAATAALLAWSLSPVHAHAQTDWPKSAVKIVVGFTPGGSNDLLARLMATKLGERLGQPFVVENKPGAQAIIAAELVARAAPDGYTILTAPAGTLAINPAVYAKLPYDALGSYEFVANIATYPFILSVNASSPINTVKELVEWGKANPTKANYASTSTIFQLTSELFNIKTGTKFEHIPFKSGGEVVSAVLTGQVTMAFADAGPAIPQIKGGKLRALATTGSARMPDLPDVPTTREAGIEGVIVEGFSGFVAPKGTPAPIIAKLESEVIAVVKLPDVRERMLQIGLIPAGEGSSAFRERVTREIAMWKDVAQKANVKLEQ